VKALFDFEAVQEGDLSFRQGDRLLVTVEYVHLRSFIYYLCAGRAKRLLFYQLLSVCLSVCLCVCLSVCLCVCLSF